MALRRPYRSSTRTRHTKRSRKASSTYLRTKHSKITALRHAFLSPIFSHASRISLYARLGLGRCSAPPQKRRRRHHTPEQPPRTSSSSSSPQRPQRFRSTNLPARDSTDTLADQDRAISLMVAFSVLDFTNRRMYPPKSTAVHGPQAAGEGFALFRVVASLYQVRVCACVSACARVYRRWTDLRATGPSAGTQECAAAHQDTKH